MIQNLRFAGRMGAFLALAWTAAAAPRAGSQAPARVPLSFEDAGGNAIAHGDGFLARFSPAGVALTTVRSRETLQMRFAGGNPHAAMAFENLQSWKANYFNGSNPKLWRRGVPQYGKLRYTGLYEGVDAVFYGLRNLMEYDFIVRPGADPGAIALDFEGARGLRMNADGSLALATAAGDMIHRKPIAYQQRGNRRVPVPARYTLSGNRVRFEVGRYDRSLPLVIDPVLQYSSYLGGSNPGNAGDDMAYAVALDTDENIYITGRSVSRDFPLKDAIQSENKGSGDAFVIKLDPTGQNVIYATYLGGGSLEYGYAIAVDTNGQAHVAGQTGSAGFPLQAAHQSKIGGLNDCFVAKLSAAGDSLLFSTLLGGERNDQINGIGVDQFGNVYVGGYTNSTTFPTLNALQAKLGGSSDGVLAKFSPEGALLYSTFVGGAGQDEIYGLAVDADGNAYATGFILSPDLATSSAAQTRLLSRDAFVAKLTPDGQAWSYFTYVGGRGTDFANAIAVDAQGNAYIGGYTDSSDLPASSAAFQVQRAGNSDAFVAKIDASGSSILWSSYLGGTARSNQDDEIVKAIAVDPDGCVYATGSTTSTDFPVNRSTQPTAGGARDAFVAKIAPAGDQLIFSTFTGGQAQDDGLGLAVTRLRAFYTVGHTFSTDLPLEKPFSGQRGATADAFVSRICDPVLFVSAGEFNFTWVQGGEKPGPQTLQVAACKNLELSAVRGDDAGWLSATPAAGENGVTPVTLAVDPGTLAPGEYRTTLSVSAPDVFFGPISVPVVLRIAPPPDQNTEQPEQPQEPEQPQQPEEPQPEQPQDPGPPPEEPAE